MATYDELLSAAGNTALLNKMRVAVIIAAEKVRVEADTVPQHAARLKWAKAVYADPLAEARRVMWSVLAQNASAPLASITGATDAIVQAAVDACVNLFANEG